MNLSFYIARRYILGKKSHNAINVVSAISVLGVVVGTIAFILILSVFNGFDQLVKSMYNSFYPDVAITPASGKVFMLTEDKLKQIEETDGVEQMARILEDNGLLAYNNKQTVSTVRGVSDNYKEVTKIDSLIWQGEYILNFKNMPRAVMGRGLAYHLGLNPDLYEPLKIFVPKRKARISMDPNKSLNTKYILVTGIFSSQPDIDGRYTIVPLSFAQKLFGYTNELSSLEIKLSADASSAEVIQNIKQILGEDYLIKDKIQQNELLYKTMRTEKWAIFSILALVLIILLFSLVSSLSMLIIEKKKDIQILQSLGASQKLISNIFYREGLIITFTGVFIGLLIGSTISLLQEHYGFIKLQGSFIINAYPVDMQLGDIIIVVATVLIIGTLASWYPVRFLLKKSLLQ